MSDAPLPISFQWNGEAMVPLNGKAADRQYVVGETYRLVQHEDRSRNSHNHYFAAIAEAHKNLPEDASERYPTADHLRKWALIKAGYRDERSFACATNEEALQLASFVKPIDDYAVVVVRENTVVVYTAKSQSVHSMGKPTFQKSKQAVLDIVSEIIGTDAGTLRKNAARAA